MFCASFGTLLRRRLLTEPRTLAFDFMEKLTAIAVDDNRPELAVSTRRPYYNQRNALSVKGIFDDYLSNPRTLLVPASQGSISTLYNKVVYGIKWLAEKSAEGQKYAELRARIGIKPTANGIVIKAKTGVPPVQAVAVADVIGITWFDRFKEWMASAKAGEMFDSTLFYGGVIQITPDDENALIRICAQANLELEVNQAEGKFRAMR